MFLLLFTGDPAEKQKLKERLQNSQKIYGWLNTRGVSHRTITFTVEIKTTLTNYQQVKNPDSGLNDDHLLSCVL